MVEPVPQQLISRWRRFSPDQGGSLENALFYLRSQGFRVEGKNIFCPVNRKLSTANLSAITFLKCAFDFNRRES